MIGSTYFIRYFIGQNETSRRLKIETDEKEHVESILVWNILESGKSSCVPTKVPVAALFQFEYGPR